MNATTVRELLSAAVRVVLCSLVQDNKGGGIFELGFEGIIGTSFEVDTASDIKVLLKESGKDALGEPFLYQIFGQTPQQDNFIGISL
jgi:hypothetical protein